MAKDTLMLMLMLLVMAFVIYSTGRDEVSKVFEWAGFVDGDADRSGEGGGSGDRATVVSSKIENVEQGGDDEKAKDDDCTKTT